MYELAAVMAALVAATFELIVLMLAAWIAALLYNVEISTDCAAAFHCHAVVIAAIVASVPAAK